MPKGLLINVNGCHLSLWVLFRLPLLSEYSHGFYKLFPLYIQAIEGFLTFVQKMRRQKKKKNCYFIKPMRCSFKKETLFFFKIQLSNKYMQSNSKHGISISQFYSLSCSLYLSICPIRINQNRKYGFLSHNKLNANTFFDFIASSVVTEIINFIGMALYRYHFLPI